MKKFLKFFVIGVGTTLIEYIVFTVVARTMSNDFLWLATLIGGIIGAIFGFFLNAKLVWKGKNAGKKEAAKFFIYNVGIKTFIIKEIFTFLFGLITPLYVFAYNICQAIHIPFDYDFVESTGIFALTALATMMISYFAYDKVVFTKKKEDEKGSDGGEAIS